jgi:tetratricopeptide (TPR) repeat protein
MVALAAWLLLLVLLGACAGSGGLGDRIHEAMLDATLHPEERAVALYEAGRYAQAEPYAKEALERAEDLYVAEGGTLDFFAGFLGLASPGLGTSLNNLAMIYEKQGRYAEAEPLLTRALAIQEKALGPDHPDVADSLNNLATLYAEQGRYAEAEQLYKRALAIREAALGPDHPDLANSLNNLAAFYAEQGRYAEAEPLFERALAIREKALGRTTGT